MSQRPMPIASGVLRDALDANSKKITNLAEPTATTDAATKNYVDTHAGGSPTWANIQNKPTTVAGYAITDAYTKTATDALLAGKANATHTHAQSDVTGLGDALAAKRDRTDMFTEWTTSVSISPYTLRWYSEEEMGAGWSPSDSAGWVGAKKGNASSTALSWSADEWEGGFAFTATRQRILTTGDIDATPTASSANPVQSGGVVTALDVKRDKTDLIYGDWVAGSGAPSDLQGQPTFEDGQGWLWISPSLGNYVSAVGKSVASTVFENVSDPTRTFTATRETLALTSAIATHNASNAAHGDIRTAVGEKADKVASPTAGDFAALDANGNLTDSGKKAADFATAAQGAKADSAVQSFSAVGGVTPTVSEGVADVSSLFTSANTSLNLDNIRVSAVNATTASTLIGGKITAPSDGSVGDVLKKTATGVEWGSGGGGGGGTLWDLELTKAENIPASAYRGAGTLKSVTSLSTNNTIGVGDMAFAYLPNLKTVNIAKAGTISSNAFYGSAVESMVIGGVTSLTSLWGPYGATSVKTVSFPDVTSIGQYSFSSCQQLESISLPLLTTIGQGSFKNTLSLVSLSLPRATNFEDGQISGSGVERLYLQSLTTGNNVINNCHVSVLYMPNYTEASGATSGYYFLGQYNDSDNEATIALGLLTKANGFFLNNMYNTRCPKVSVIIKNTIASARALTNGVDSTATFPFNLGGNGTKNRWTMYCSDAKVTWNGSAWIDTPYSSTSDLPELGFSDYLFSVNGTNYRWNSETEQYEVEA